MAIEDDIQAFTDNVENLNGALDEFVDSMRASVNAAGNSNKATTEQTTTAMKNASSFDALDAAVQGSRDEQEAYMNIVEASGAVWDSMTGAVSDAASVLMTLTNDLLSGEGFGMFKSMIDPIADVMETLGAVAGDLIGGFLKLGGDIPLVGAAFETLGDLADSAGEALGKVAASAFKFIANLALDTTQQLWDMFEGAASSGLLVTNGLSEMKSQMTSLNLTTTEYTSLIKSQAKNMTIFGGSVAEGAKKLAEVAKAAGQHNQELRGLGISYQEQAEMTSEFMESMARTGQINVMNSQDLADASFDYMKNLRVVSALTGKSAEDMKKDRDAALQNMAFQAKLAKMDPKVRVEMEAALGALPEGMQQAFKESVIFGKVMTDTGAIVSGSAEYIENFANSVANGTADFDEAFQTFRTDMKDAAPELRKNLEGLAAAGMAELIGQGTAVTGSLNKSAVTLYEVLANVEAGTALDVENAKNAGKSAGESVKHVINMMDTQRKLMNTILDEAEKRLPATSLLLQNITKGVSDMIDKLNEESKEGGAIDDAKKMFGAGIDTISEMATSVMETVTNAMDAGLKAFRSMSNMIDDIVASTTYKMLFGRDIIEGEWFPDKSPEAIAKKDIRIAEMKESPEKTMEQIESAQAKIYDIEGQQKMSLGRTRKDLDPTYEGPTRAQETEALLKLIKILEEKAISDEANNIEANKLRKQAVVNSATLIDETRQTTLAVDGIR